MNLPISSCQTGRRVWANRVGAQTMMRHVTATTTCDSAASFQGGSRHFHNEGFSSHSRNPLVGSFPIAKYPSSESMRRILSQGFPFSSDSKSNNKGSVRICTPTMKSTSTWESAANRVKNTASEKSNPYIEKLRDSHDPSMHLKTIEDELKGSIGQALGKQGRKIFRFMGSMQESYDIYQSATSEHEEHQPSSPKKGNSNNSSAVVPQRAKEAAIKFNEYRQLAVTARWELQVHRQAAGFIVDNHNHVRDHYPIPKALPFDTNGNAITEEEKKPFNKFGDQLDWWQKEGRWK